MPCSVDAVDTPQLRFVGVKSVPKVLAGSLFKGGQNSSSQIKTRSNEGYLWVFHLLYC